MQKKYFRKNRGRLKMICLRECSHSYRKKHKSFFLNSLATDWQQKKDWHEKHGPLPLCGIDSNLIKNFFSEIIVYPNAAHNQLFVDAANYSTLILKLYNIMGELVMDKSVANATSINISSLSSGVYTFKVLSSDNELKVGKVIITH